MSRSVIVKQDETKPVAIEVMAESIVAISSGIRKLRAGPLNDRALILLIQHAAPGMGYGGRQKIGQTEIRSVLEGIDSLERAYLKPKKERKP